MMTCSPNQQRLSKSPKHDSASNDKLWTVVNMKFNFIPKNSINSFNSMQLSQFWLQVVSKYLYIQR